VRNNTHLFVNDCNGKVRLRKRKVENDNGKIDVCSDSAGGDGDVEGGNNQVQKILFELCRLRLVRVIRSADLEEVSGTSMVPESRI